MRTVSGYINEDGSILSRTGGDYDVTVGGTGLYDIHFHPHFETPPAVVACQVWEKNGPGGGNPLDNVAISMLNNGMVRLKTGDSRGSAENRKFTFIAMGN